MNDTLFLRRTSAIIVLLAISGCGGSGSGNPNPPSTLPPITTPPTTLVVTSLCTAPTPPPLFGMRVKLHFVNPENPDRRQLDSWPLVPNVDGYCTRVGLDGERCETRGHDHPQRPACDALVVGRATDTARFGPTWTVDGRPCTPAVNPGDPGCSNHPDNQFLIVTRGGGEFLACASDSVPLAEGGSRCGGFEIP